MAILSDDQRRALQFLARSADGCTEALMMAQRRPHLRRPGRSARIASVIPVDKPSASPLRRTVQSRFLATTIALGSLATKLRGSSMQRREFIAGLGSTAAWPVTARAQQSGTPVIGFLHGQSEAATRDIMPAFYKGLAELGFVEGRNVTIEHRWDEGHAERWPTLAAEVVRRQVSVIVVDITLFTKAAKAATSSIPIVYMGGDPIEFGLVASINHPGGNVTGVAVLGPNLTAKRLELLHKLVPGSGPIAAFVGAANQFGKLEARELQSAAQALGIEVKLTNVVARGDFPAAYARLMEQGARALLLSSNILFRQERDQIIQLAARRGLPTMFWDSSSVAAGALSSYGPDFYDAYHQTGLYTARILRGENPADMPVMLPTRYELVFNLGTSKALGLTIPETLLATADKVIE
jgi:putative ABC transport system substrate-binding protein